MGKRPVIRGNQSGPKGHDGPADPDFARGTLVPPAVWALGSVAAVLLAAYPHLVLFAETIVAGDMAHMHHPLRRWMLERFSNGELPLWYPFHDLGTPFIGIAVSAVFHPFTLFYLALGPVHGLTASVLACVALSVLGTWWLARRMGADAVGASVAGVAAGLSGPFVSALDNITFLVGASGLAWFLAGLHLAASTGGCLQRGVVVAGAALAFPLLCGDVQGAYFYVLVGVPFALVLADRPRWRGAVSIGAVGLLGVALAAVQVIPLAGLVLASDRASGLSWETATLWSLHPLRLADLFLNDLLRHAPPGAGEPILGPLFGLDRSLPWTPTAFLGVVTGLGMLWSVALGGGSRQARWLLTSLFVVLVAVALGHHGGVYRVLYAVLPGWSAFRYPEKALPFAAVLASVLAGMGVSRALSQPARAARVAMIAAGTLGLTWLLVHLDPGVWTGRVSDLAPANLRPADVAYLSGVHASRLDDAMLRAAIICLGGAAIAFSARHAIGWRIAPLVLIAGHLADLASGNTHAIRFRSAEAAAMDGPSVFVPTLRKLEGAGTGRYRVATLVSAIRGLNTPAVQARGGMTDLGVVAFGRHALLPLYAGRFHVESTVPYLPGRSLRLAQRFVYAPRVAVAMEVPLFNARYLITDRPLFAKLGWPPETIVSYEPTVDLLLVRTPPALFRPRAFLSWPLEVADEQAARAALDIRAVRLGRIAVVETTGAGGEGPPQREVPGAVTMVNHSPEQVEVDVTLDGNRPVVLVLNDAWHPGWTATLDGAPTSILRANYLVRGVRVPPGRHRVVFSFPVPLGLIAGGLISALAVVGAGAALLVRQ